MGRWAQAKRRGRTPTQGAVGEPPPAPVLANDEGAVVQTAQGDEDLGGQVRLWRSDGPGPPWLPIRSEDWESVFYWGQADEMDEGFYRVTEIGNGTTYVGESVSSGILEIE